MNTPNPGFLVWNPNGNAPHKQHGTFDGARTEAERLSKQNPGQAFYVLAAIGAAFAERPSVSFTPLIPSDLPLAPAPAARWDSGDDDIPF